MDEINQILKEFIINEFLTSQSTNTLEQNFPLIEEGVIDSLRIFLLINFIEEKFGVKIQPGDVILENFQDLRSLTELVNLRKPKSSPVKI